MAKDCVLETSGKVGNEFFGKFRLILFEEVAGAGFEAGEGEIEILAVSHGFGEVINRFAEFGHFGQNGAAGVSERKHAGDFVVGFASRVVQCFAEELIIADTFHKD